MENSLRGHSTKVTSKAQEDAIYLKFGNVPCCVLTSISQLLLVKKQTVVFFCGLGVVSLPQAYPNPTPTQPQPNPNPTPTQPQPNPNPTPTQPQPNPNPTPTQPQPNPNPTPTLPQPYPNPTPTLPQPYPNPTPTLVFGWGGGLSNYSFSSWPWLTRILLNNVSQKFVGGWGAVVDFLIIVSAPGPG